MKASAYSHPKKAPNAAPLQLATPETIPTPKTQPEAVKVPPIVPEPSNANRQNPPKERRPRPIRINPTPRLTQRDIPELIRRACMECVCSTEDFYSRRRHASTTTARMIVVKLLRENSNLSFPEIAHATARPNHSTTIEQYQRMNARLLLPCGDELRRAQLTLTYAADIGVLLGAVTEAIGLPALSDESHPLTGMEAA